MITFDLKITHSENYLQLWCVVFIFVLLTSCAAPTRTITARDLTNEASVFKENYADELDYISAKSYMRLTTEYSDELNGLQEQSYDILVLSGGGEFGAFGAGFLDGWGAITSGVFKRPQFDSVSGISTGALIAPFAFVGSEDAYKTIVDIYKNPAKDMIVAKTMLKILSGSNAFYDASKLHDQIKAGISDSLISAIAEKSRENRLLLVGATNLDYGVMRVWDLADIAMNQTVEDSKQLIAERLLASSAIPGAFPPVIIDNNLYVDGGASMQVVSGIDNREWLYNSEQNVKLDFVQSRNPIKIRIWMIVNNKLVLEPEVTAPTWANIAKRSIISLMRGSTLQSIQDTETFVKMIDARPEFDVEMRFVAIPQDYQIVKSDDMFNQEKMLDLIKLGQSMGQDKNSWRTKAIRPGASFIDIKESDNE